MSEPVELYVEHSGRGTPPWVFAHGFGGSCRNFRPQAKVLRERACCWLYDARGHARSEAPTDPDAYTLTALVEDMGRICERTTSDKVVVAGLSLGAVTALGFAQAHPERVHGLVLASLPSVDSARRVWADAFARAIDEDGLETAGERYVWGERSRLDSVGADKVRRGFLEHPPHAIAHILRGVLAELPAPSKLAENLECPMLVISGSRDAAAMHQAYALQHRLPAARFEVIANAGHVVNLAAPEAFNRLLVEFADDIDPHS